MPRWLPRSKGGAARPRSWRRTSTRRELPARRIRHSARERRGSACVLTALRALPACRSSSRRGCPGSPSIQSTLRTSLANAGGRERVRRSCGSEASGASQASTSAGAPRSSNCRASPSEGMAVLRIVSIDRMAMPRLPRSLISLLLDVRKSGLRGLYRDGDARRSISELRVRRVPVGDDRPELHRLITARFTAA